MSSKITFETNEGEYATKAFGFVVADDLYTFFKFVSPNSDCEIGIAYDQFVDGGDWYVSDGYLDGQDSQIVTDIVFDKLACSPEFLKLNAAIDAAMSVFNGVD